MSNIPGLRSSHDQVDGLIHFGRMVDKIRLHARGELPLENHAALGNGHDRILSGFLQLSYARLQKQVLENPSATDEQLLEWAYQNGRRLTPADLVVINGFLSKPAWRDESASNCPGWLVKSAAPFAPPQTNFGQGEQHESQSTRDVAVL